MGKSYCQFGVSIKIFLGCCHFSILLPIIQLNDFLRGHHKPERFYAIIVKFLNNVLTIKNTSTQKFVLVFLIVFFFTQE